MSLLIVSEGLEAIVIHWGQRNFITKSNVLVMKGTVIFLFDCDLWYVFMGHDSFCEVSWIAVSAETLGKLELFLLA